MPPLGSVVIRVWAMPNRVKSRLAAKSAGVLPVAAVSTGSRVWMAALL